MAYSPDQLAHHLADYERVFGHRAEHFFCPLTRAFKTTDLMDGHVFSKQFKCSKDTTVVQWRPIDNWFGSAYENHLVRFWRKAKKLTPEERLRWGEFYFRFSKFPRPVDGPEALDEPEYRAHLKESKVGQQLTSPDSGLQWWTTTISTPLGPREFVAQGLRVDELPEFPYVHLLERTIFLPMMVSAAMMKAGFLTLFWLMGYECIKNPLVELVGNRIKGSFEDNAREETAYKYWAEFENAYALIEACSPGLSGETTPWLFNTITSRTALELHHDGIQFAFVFAYDVDGVTVQATFPFTPRTDDADVAWKTYCAYLIREFVVDQAVESRWDGTRWQPSGLVRYVDQGSPMDYARQLARGLRGPDQGDEPGSGSSR